MKNSTISKIAMMKYKYTYWLTAMLAMFSLPIFGQYSIDMITPASGGECNGAVTITVDTTKAPHQFLWSNGATTANISEVCPGIYAVVIEDKDGCSWELEAEVTAASGCYVEQESITANILDYCGPHPDGSIQVTVSSTIDYVYAWSNGGTGASVDSLEVGSYTLSITDPDDASCTLTKTYTIEQSTNCQSGGGGGSDGEGGVAIIINEAANGLSSNGEYIELVVVGTGSCDPIDLRGFILDDNNGDFSNPDHGICNTGFSGGHVRFADISRWASIRPGTIILLYNPNQKSSDIVLADDPTDADGDGVFVLPINNMGIEGTHLFPSYAQPYNYPSDISYEEASWTYIAIKDSRDAIQLRYPDGSYCHGISFGDASYMSGGPSNLQLSGGSTLDQILAFNNGNPNDKSNFSISQAATPGYPNNTDNEAYLKAISCSGGTLIVNEFSNGANEQQGYVELLVKGDDNCAEVDLRGYILDDNNGDFSIATEGSGISSGHIRFPETDAWLAIPSGSLIVLYNPAEKNAAIGSDDPSDSNDDGIYILSVAALEGNANSPTPAQPNQYTSANYTAGSWTYMALHTYGDAMQVRSPEGSYVHGISYSSSIINKVHGGPEDLLIDTTNNRNKVYFFQADNAKVVSNFSTGDLSSVSPGAPNNAANEAYIESLVCSTDSGLDEIPSISASARGVRAQTWPNPFNKELHLELKITYSVEVTILIHDLLGKQLYEQPASLQKGQNDITLNLAAVVDNGMYYISVLSDTDRVVLHEEKVVCVRR